MTGIETIYSPGCDTYAFIASSILQSTNQKRMLIIVSNTRDLNTVKHNLKFFLQSDVTIVDIPEWNCGFYDISPISASISTSRISALVDLISSDSYIAIATVKSVMTKLPPKSFISSANVNLRVGQRFDINDIVSKIIGIGYCENDAINLGEFTLHKTGIDINCLEVGTFFKIGINGDLIESIKIFNMDPSPPEKTLDTVSIIPTRESILNDETIVNFDSHYHNSSSHICDPEVYEMMISKIPPPNIHHYIPLLYDKLDTIFDYLYNSITLYDDMFFQKIDEYEKMIRVENEIYNKENISKNTIDQLFLTKNEIISHLKSFKCIHLSALRNT